MGTARTVVLLLCYRLYRPYIAYSPLPVPLWLLSRSLLLYVYQTPTGNFDSGPAPHLPLYTSSLLTTAIPLPSLFSIALPPVYLPPPARRWERPPPAAANYCSWRVATFPPWATGSQGATRMSLLTNSLLSWVDAHACSRVSRFVCCGRSTDYYKWSPRCRVCSEVRYREVDELPFSQLTEDPPRHVWFSTCCKLR